MQRERQCNDSKLSFKKKITIDKKDQNLAFWEYDKYFGKNDEIFHITESQKEKYINEIGEQSFAQGYITAKVLLYFIILT